MPNTVDSITTSAIIISGLQTVVSRKANLTESPVRYHRNHQRRNSSQHRGRNGTHDGPLRAYDEKVREQARRDIHLAVEKIAESADAKATVSITRNYETSVNDEKLTAQMAPVLKRAADGKVTTVPLVGASEDFSCYARATPGLFVSSA